MVRSEKPEIQKTSDDPSKKITQEELDYIKYVESGNNKNNAT
jgi:hypothetical protein